MSLPANTLFSTPKDVSAQAATQFETVIVPIHLVRNIVQIQPGERVVITGPGPIGALCANMARLAGASHINMLGGPGDEKRRLATAAEMGADVAVPFAPKALESLCGESAPSMARDLRRPGRHRRHSQSCRQAWSHLYQRHGKRIMRYQYTPRGL